MASLNLVTTTTIKADLTEREFLLICEALEERNDQLQKSDPSGDWNDLYALREQFKDFIWGGC